MSTYQLYQKARDTAWRALLQLPDKKLPVDPYALAEALGIEIHPYPAPGEAALAEEHLEKAGGGMGVSLKVQGQWHIFIRQNRSDDNRQRFAAAHELGHILLEHSTRSLTPQVQCLHSRENEGDLMEDPEDLEDYAADIFAIRLLAPACVLHELQAESAWDIAALCALPPRAASLRAERMQLLNERNDFYSHPLERKVLDQFRPYLMERGAQIGVFSPPVQMEHAPVSHPARMPLILPESRYAPREDSPDPKTQRRRSFPFYRKKSFLYAARIVIVAVVVLLCLIFFR